MVTRPIRPGFVAPLLGMLCGLAQPALGQGAQRPPVGWEGDPGPLAPVADLERTPPSAPEFPGLLTAPLPRAGLYWTAGNPAALPFEVWDRYTEVRAGVTDERGAYRRPLDPASTGGLAVSASGWRSIGAGAVSGGILVERSSLDELAAGVGTPHAMSPHLFADTTTAALGRTAARLEGQGGWRVGDWGFGIALGFETWTTRTGVATVPRYQRGVLPAATAGLTRRVGHLLVGAHARWQTEVQTLSLVAKSTSALVYTLAGYTEPVAVPLGVGQGFSRRIERDAAAAGLGAALDAAGVRWIAFADLTRLREEQSAQQANDPPLDRWDATGHVLGLSAEADLAGGRGRVVAGGRWTHVSGEALRAGLEEQGVLFRETDDVLDVGVDVRLGIGSRWEAAARTAVSYGDDTRDDAMARVATALRIWRPSITIEAAYEPGNAFALSVGAGLAWSTPIGTIPSPGSLGDGYREWLAPEWSYYGTPARTTAVRMALRWRTGGHDLALAIGYASTGSRGATAQLPASPVGGRRRWEVSVMVMR
jgi:hypothetical protein